MGGVAASTSAPMSVNPNKRHVQRLNHDAYRLGTCDVAADGSTLSSGGVLQRVRCAGTPQSVTGTVVQDMNSQGPALFGHRPRILSSDDIADAWKMSARLARLPAAGARADRLARGTGPVAARNPSRCRATRGGPLGTQISPGRGRCPEARRVGEAG